jgi:hypothetical protein
MIWYDSAINTRTHNLFIGILWKLRRDTRPGDGSGSPVQVSGGET